MAEFSSYRVPSCRLIWENDQWVVKYFLEGEWRKVYLADCMVVQALDPAATEKYISAKTSRSAQLVVAHAPSDLRFFLSIHADYVPTTEAVQWLFEDFDRFAGHVTLSLMEAGGPFKALNSFIEDEQQKREKYIGYRPVSAVGDKDVRIRTALQPLLDRSLIYVEERCLELFHEEKMGFPGSYKKDILDAAAIACQNTVRPLTAREIVEEEEEEEWFANRTTNVMGY
jgi:hypothetical protein